jgi:transposase-like protein
VASVRDGSQRLSDSGRHSCKPGAGLAQRVNLKPHKDVACRSIHQLVQPLSIVFRASSHAEALKRGRGLIAKFRDRYPAEWSLWSGISRNVSRIYDFRRCTTFPIRTTYQLERLNRKGRLRNESDSRFPTRASCLSLLFASLATASKRWRGITVR